MAYLIQFSSKYDLRGRIESLQDRMSTVRKRISKAEVITKALDLLEAELGKAPPAESEKPIF